MNFSDDIPEDDHPKERVETPQDTPAQISTVPGINTSTDSLAGRNYHTWSKDKPVGTQLPRSVRVIGLPRMCSSGEGEDIRRYGQTVESMEGVVRETAWRLTPDDDPANPNRRWGSTIKTPAGEKLSGYLTEKSTRIRTPSDEVAYARARVGQGRRVTTVLTSSCFTLKSYPPTQQHLFNVWDQISAMEVAVGRRMLGRMWSNSRVRSIGVIVREFLLPMFALEDCALALPEAKTPAEEKEANILSHIKIFDLNTLVMTSMGSHWPQGYHYGRPCMHCGKIHVGLADLIKMVHPDDAALNDSARELIARTPEKRFTTDELKKVQDSQLCNQEHSFVFEQKAGLNQPASKMRFVLSVPSIYDFLEHGEIYLRGLEAMRPKRDDVSVTTRNNQLEVLARTTRMREFGHFMERLEYLDDEGQVEHTVVRGERLNAIMDVLSQNDELVDVWVKECQGFIERSTTTFVGIPSFKCPAPDCLKENVDAKQLERWPGMVAVDPISLFFALTERERLAVAPE